MPKIKNWSKKESYPPKSVWMREDGAKIRMTKRKNGKWAVTGMREYGFNRVFDTRKEAEKWATSWMKDHTVLTRN